MTHPNELPNTCLFVSVSTSLKSNWTPVGATEIIEVICSISNFLLRFVLIFFTLHVSEKTSRNLVC